MRDCEFDMKTDLKEILMKMFLSFGREPVRIRAYYYYEDTPFLEFYNLDNKLIGFIVIEGL
jgi:hypothetical protein